MRRRNVLIITSVVACCVVLASLVYGMNRGSPNEVSKPVLPTATRWTSIGPAPLQNEDAGYPVSGRILSIAVSGSDLYVGSADGGLWVSRNGGTSWFPLTDSEPSLAVQSIAIDPKDPRTIYLGTGEAHGFVVPYSYPNAFFGTGVLKSTDGGLHWVDEGRSAFGNWNVRDVLVDPAQPSNLVAAAGPEILRSTNAGANWEHVFTSPNGYRIMQVTRNPGNPKQLIAGIEGKGLVESDDGGLTWRTMPSAPNDTGTEGVSIAFSPRDPNVVYYLVSNYQHSSDSGLYVSKNDGHSWKKQADLKNVLTDTVAHDTPHVEVAVDPTNPQHLFVGGYQIAESFDGGRTWGVVQLVHMDDHAIVFNAQGTAYFGTDGGIWSSRNGYPSDLNTNLDITQFYAGMTISPDGHLFAGTQDNGNIEYLPKSHTWIEITEGDGGYTAEDPQNPKVLYAELDFPRILLKSTNGGATWSKISPTFKADQTSLEIMPLDISTKKPSQLLLGADRVYTSRDAGSSWTAISPVWTFAGQPDVISSLASPTGDPNDIYAGTLGGRLYRTSDGGKTWHNVTPAESLYGGAGMVVSVVLNPTNPNQAYAVFGSNGAIQFVKPSGPAVFYTGNGGKTWVAMDGNLPASPIGSAAFYKGALVVGTANGVYMSPWAKKTWQQVGTGLPNTPVTTLGFSKTEVYAATVGRGVWVMPLPKQ